VLWEENLLWEESKRAFHWEGFTSDTRSYFPSKIGPNPDLSYGFKATHFNDQRGFEGMPYFNNFSFDVLGKLRAKTPAIRSTVTPGLSEWMLWQANHENETNETKNEPHKHRSRPGKNFDRYGMYKTYSPKDLPSSDFLCFPWAVVEAKHAQLEMSAEEYCQCQLANATACAYDLQETLIRSVNDSCPVDPIIGFTCIGPRVKLWLTYRGDDNKMVSSLRINNHRL
jgi:hypothetical protein